MNSSISILETKEFKLKFLERIGYANLQTTVKIEKSRLLSFETDFSRLVLKMEGVFINSIALLQKLI